MNNLTIYNKIIEARGLRKLNYQEEFLTSELKTDKPMVYAAGTSGGKTLVTIMQLEIFYSYSENKNKRSLIIPYSMKVLRDNFEDELEKFEPSFSFCVATTKEELLNALKSNCQVVVALPQAVSIVIDSLPIFHNFILDEAHQWYGEKTINSILKKIKPTYELLLTGTPSRFIMKGDKFNFHFVPVMDLFDLNHVTDVRLEVVSSNYNFKHTDFVGTFGKLKENVNMSNKSTDEALTMVCKEMLRRIKNPIKQPNASRVTKNVLSVFNKIGKTIIFCHSLKQADAIYKSLNGFSELTGKVLVSHSKNDHNSEGFVKFKNSDEYSVLVAVDRGKLGFNIPELFNIVDFTLTQSLDMLMQMYGRLLRLSTTDKPKTYYKVATKDTAPYYLSLMYGMMCLTMKEWYSKYNGKNMDGILIPVFNKTSKNKSNSPNTKQTKRKFKPNVNITELGIPLNLNLFKSVYYNYDDKFGPVGFTTLGDCRREFYGLNDKWSEEEIREEALKYDTRKAFREKSSAAHKKAYRLNILDDVCSHMDTLRKYWSEEEIREEALKYDKRTEFAENNKAYGAAQRLGILDDVCSHMEIIKKHKWSEEEIREEALKYDKRVEFKKNNGSVYKAARNLGILDKVCSHMKKIK